MAPEVLLVSWAVMPEGALGVQPPGFQRGLCSQGVTHTHPVQFAPAIYWQHNFIALMT